MKRNRLWERGSTEKRFKCRNEMAYNERDRKKLKGTKHEKRK